jgi:hypothetical protein
VIDGAALLIESGFLWLADNDSLPPFTSRWSISNLQRIADTYGAKDELLLSVTSGRLHLLGKSVDYNRQ